MHERLSPEKTDIEKLSQWLKARQIELVLFDLDDTLIDTSQVFITQAQKFVTRARENLPGLNPQELTKNFSRLEGKFFLTHAVNPVRYAEIVAELGRIYQPRFGPKAAGIFQEGLPILLQTYRTVPEFYPGAEQTLKDFKTTGVSLGLVTHGNLTWTNLKIRGLDLARFFQHFWIVDQDEFKSPEDWFRAIAWQFGKKPANTLVVGDNVRGDIQAAHLVGVKHKVLIPSPWSVYTEGQIPEGTLRIPSINQLINTLVN